MAKGGIGDQRNNSKITNKISTYKNFEKLGKHDRSIEYLEEDILLDFSLYTADSTLYHATYQGPATYR